VQYLCDSITLICKPTFITIIIRISDIFGDSGEGSYRETDIFTWHDDSDIDSYYL